jgi:hypothetical protein
MDLTSVILAGADVPEGRSVFPAVLRVAHKKQVPLRRVVVSGDFKRIEGHELFGDVEGFLFDVSHDPFESNNLRKANGAVFEALAGEAREWERRLSPVSAVDQRTGQPFAAAGSPTLEGLSEEEKERLEALGYVN